MGWYLESNRADALAMRPQLSHNVAPAVDGRDSPRQCQHVTPVTVSMEHRPEQGVVAIAQRSFQLSKPMLGDCQIAFSTGKHGYASGRVSSQAKKVALNAECLTRYVRLVQSKT